MPSEDSRLAAALAALARPVAEFRTAIGGALAQAETLLEALRSDPAVRAARMAGELGEFALGRIRADAFAALAREPASDPAARAALIRAIAVLREVSGAGERFLLVDVAAGAAPELSVAAALAQVGRAYGAVRTGELVRSGRYDAKRHDHLLEPVAFRDWSASERRLAPPLIVALDGSVLQASALAGFCDGRVKLVLLVRGPCAPAPLTRLITPGTLVLQTSDAAELARLADYEGPAIAALVPEGAARFLHDPTAGKESWQRLSLRELPEAPRRSLAGASAWQMAEELRLLAALARTPFEIPSPSGAAAEPALGGPAAVERLAAWLLSGDTPPA